MLQGTLNSVPRSRLGRILKKILPALLQGVVLFWIGLTASAMAATNEGGALPSLISEVIARHPQVAVQSAALRAANAGVEGAQWQFYPTPSITMENAQVSASDTSYRGDQQVSTLGLRQSLWNGGRLSANLDKARANASLNSALLAESRLQLALRVIQSYGDWIAAFEKQKVYATGLAVHQQMKEMVVRRVQEGQSAPSDQVLAEERLAMLDAESMASTTQKLTAMLKLSQLAGRTLNEQELSRQPATVRSLEAPLEQLLRQAENSSPAMARYRAIAQSQRSAIDERKADKWPEVYARIERQFGNFSSPGLPPETRAFVGLTTHFGAGLSVQSSIAEAIGQHDAALAEIEVQRLGLQELIMVDYTSLLQAEPRRRALQEGAAKSRQVLQSWDRQFLSGRKTWQDLMNSAREHMQLEAQIADLDASRLIASWRLLALTDYEHLLTPP